MSQLTPFIWFNNNAEEAMNFYTSVFPDSRIVSIERYAGDQGIPGEQELKGKVLNGVFEIVGQQFMCLDGGPQFDAPGRISLMVEFETQEEIDAIWDGLAQEGQPQQCGWIGDKFGVIWQIVPAVMGRMMGDPNATPEQKKAVMQAMMPMVKLEIAPLEEAFQNAK